MCSNKDAHEIHRHVLALDRHQSRPKDRDPVAPGADTPWLQERHELGVGCSLLELEKCIHDRRRSTHRQRWKSVCSSKDAHEWCASF